MALIPLFFLFLRNPYFGTFPCHMVSFSFWQKFVQGTRFWLIHRISTNYPVIWQLYQLYYGIITREMNANILSHAESDELLWQLHYIPGCINYRYYGKTRWVMKLHSPPQRIEVEILTYNATQSGSHDSCGQSRELRSSKLHIWGCWDFASTLP